MYAPVCGCGCGCERLTTAFAHAQYMGGEDTRTMLETPGNMTGTTGARTRTAGKGRRAGDDWNGNTDAGEHAKDQ